MAKRSCWNCKHRQYESMFGPDFCLDYEMSTSEEECIELARECQIYEYEDPEDEDYYCPSSTNGDYSPSSPWNAPGMSVKDFI